MRVMMQDEEAPGDVGAQIYTENMTSGNEINSLRNEKPPRKLAQ